MVLKLDQKAMISTVTILSLRVYLSKKQLGPMSTLMTKNVKNRLFFLNSLEPNYLK